MLCQNNSRMVNAIKKKYTDKFEVSPRPRDEHRDELAAHGIESHGVVCVDSGGATLWKYGDHNLSQGDLDAGLEVVLKKLQ